MITTLYARVFYPGGGSRLRAPFVFSHLLACIPRNVLEALLPGDVKPSVVPFKPRYTPRHRVAIVGELLWLVVLQVGVWHLIGGDAIRYLA